MDPGLCRLLLLFRSQFQCHLPGCPPYISNSVPRLLCIMWSGFIIYIRCMCILSRSSRVQLFLTLQTLACQAPLSMGFLRQEYWSRLPCLLPGDRLDPGMEPESLISPALAVRFFITSTTWEALAIIWQYLVLSFLFVNYHPTPLELKL